MPPPATGKAKESTRKSAERDYEKGQAGDTEKPSPRRSRAREKALQREPRSSASHDALSRQARRSADSRTAKERHDAAEKAVKTKGKAGLRQEAQEAAKTRARKRAG